MTRGTVRKSGAERQRRWLTKRRAEGLVAVTLMVPARAVPDLRMAAEALQANPHLELGPLRDVGSGRLVSPRKIAARAACDGGRP